MGSLEIFHANHQWERIKNGFGFLVAPSVRCDPFRLYFYGTFCNGMLPQGPVWERFVPPIH